MLISRALKAMRRAPFTDRLFWFLLAALPVVLLTPSIHGNDGVKNYVYVRSLLFDGDLDFTNEFEHYYALEPKWFDHGTYRNDPVTGLPENLYGVGCAVLWSPFVALAHAGGTAAWQLGWKEVPDGYGPLYERAVGWASAFYGTLALFLLHGWLRRLFGGAAALGGLTLCWLASPLVFYLYFHPSMSHACSFFLVTVLLTLYATRDSRWAWAGMGVALGLLACTRFQDAAFVFILIAGETLRWWKGNYRGAAGERLSRYALFCLAGAIAFAPQLMAWHVLQGSAWSGPRGYLSQGSLGLLAPVNAPHALFSSYHGLFYWHPGLLLALFGLLTPAPYGRLRLCCLAAFAAQVWIVGSWSHWWAGASFGQRMFISALPCLAVGAAALLHAVETRPTAARRGLATLIAALIAWNAVLVMEYGLGLIPRNAPVTWRQMLEAAPRIAERHSPAALE